jgi:pyroglutamyl-peptidase
MSNIAAMARPRRTVLLTGFEAFDGQRVNPSALAVRELGGKLIAGRRVVAEVLPVTFGAAPLALLRALRAVRPELVICVGQAGGRGEISVERVAINVDDAPIADNAGAQPIDRRIAARGPAAYWSTLPIKAVVAALAERGVPASVSSTAGTFVCNHVFYSLMHALERRPRELPGARGGFIHVPLIPEQAKKREPSMPLAQIIDALEIAIATSLATRRDRRAAGGATH